MNDDDELSYGEAQEAAIELRRETYPGQAQRHLHARLRLVAGVRRPVRVGAGRSRRCCRPNADEGLDFMPTHPEGRGGAALDGLRGAAARSSRCSTRPSPTQKAEVRVVAYDLNEPEVVSRLEKLGARLKVIIDDSGAHGEPGSAETQAAERLAASAGADNVKRQHMGKLQHNKTIVVDGPQGEGGRVRLDQLHLARLLRAVQQRHRPARRRRRCRPFMAAFDDYWEQATCGRLRQDRLGRLDRPRARRDRRAGRVLAARHGERAAGRRSPTTSAATDVEPVLLAGVPLPDARRRSWTRSRR